VLVLGARRLAFHGVDSDLSRGTSTVLKNGGTDQPHASAHQYPETKAALSFRMGYRFDEVVFTHRVDVRSARGPRRKNVLPEGSSG